MVLTLKAEAIEFSPSTLPLSFSNEVQYADAVPESEIVAIVAVAGLPENPDLQFAVARSPNGFRIGSLHSQNVDRSGQPITQIVVGEGITFAPDNERKHFGSLGDGQSGAGTLGATSFGRQLRFGRDVAFAAWTDTSGTFHFKDGYNDGQPSAHGCKVTYIAPVTTKL